MNSPFGESTCHCFCTRFGDEEMILAGNIDYRGISQKTLKQFLGQQLQKTKFELKEQCHCVSVRIRVCLCFSKVRFSLAFYRRNLVVFLWNLIWNSFYTVENPNLCWPGGPCFWRFPRRWIKVSVARSIILFTRTALPCLYFFLNPPAETMLNMIFNTLLQIKPDNTERGRRKNKEQSRDLHDDLRGGLPIRLLTIEQRLSKLLPAINWEIISIPRGIIGALQSL